MTPPPVAAPRRRGRKVLILIIALLVIVGLLFGLDRAAAAYTANRIATTLQNEGFPVRPNVSVEGFPFLTQLISRHLQGVEVTAPRYPIGSVTASIHVHAQDITLDSGYQSGTIAQVTGTGLVPFASLARMPGLAAVPGLLISGDGPHMVKLSANLGVFAASAIARVTQTAGIRRMRSRMGASSAAGTPLEETMRRLISFLAVWFTRAMADAANTARLALSLTMCGPSLLICSPGTAARPGSLARLVNGIRPVPVTCAMVPDR